MTPLETAKEIIGGHPSWESEEKIKWIVEAIEEAKREERARAIAIVQEEIRLKEAYIQRLVTMLSPSATTAYQLGEAREILRQLQGGLTGIICDGNP